MKWLEDVIVSLVIKTIGHPSHALLKGFDVLWHFAFDYSNSPARRHHSRQHDHGLEPPIHKVTRRDFEVTDGFSFSSR